MQEHGHRFGVDEAQASVRQPLAGSRRRAPAEPVQLCHAALAAGDVEERVRTVQLALSRPAGEELEADRPEVLQVDDRLEDAGQLLAVHDRLELLAEAGADLVALRFDRLGGARDGVQQRALEADLGRLGESRRADEEVDLGEQAALQLGLEPREQVLLKALLDHQQVLLGDEPGVP